MIAEGTYLAGLVSRIVLGKSDSLIKEQMEIIQGTVLHAQCFQSGSVNLKQAPKQQTRLNRLPYATKGKTLQGKVVLRTGKCLQGDCQNRILELWHIIGGGGKFSDGEGLKKLSGKIASNTCKNFRSLGQ